MSDEKSPSAMLAQSKHTAKKKAASKSKSKSKAQQAEVDVFESVSKQVETLSKDDALALADTLSNEVDFNYFMLGGALSVIQDHQWYVDEGYSDFKEFVAERYGMQYRKAMYLISIYTNLIEAEIPFEKVGHLGWSKLKELSGILTQENVDEWVKLAEKLSFRELLVSVKDYKAKQQGEPSTTSTQEPGKTVYTMSFKFFEDQKAVIDQAIAQAMEEANTDSKGQGLEAICMAYLAGGGTKKKPEITAGGLEKLGLDKSLELLDKAFPLADIEVTLTSEDMESA